MLGKGDALWRSLAVARGEIVVFVDSDTRDFPAHFVTGLVGPLLCEPAVDFVKALVPAAVQLRRGRARRRRRPRERAHGAAAARRPSIPSSPASAAARGRGGRPPVAARADPVRHRLRGRDRRCCSTCATPPGVDAMAQVDLGERRNDHQPLEALRPMADAVLRDRLRAPAARGAVCSPTSRHRRRRRAAAVRPGAAARSDGPALRLRRPRRHPARRGRLALPRRRGRVHDAAGARRSRPATAPASSCS